MQPTMKARLTQTFDGKPLAVVDLAGPGAELRPDQLRALAAVLVQIADDCEAQPMSPKKYREQMRTYATTVT